MQKKLYKIKYFGGTIEKVEWYKLPSERREQILYGRDPFKSFVTFFPIMAIVTSFICALVNILDVK